ncbi:MAG: hypothetical protein GXO88_04895 [Chlorobi bacterium]|nr:hypothetical protein [Chlorobiota bacterium]
MKSFKTFVKQITILTAVMLLLSMVVYYFAPKIKISPAFFYILIFLYASNIGIFKMLSRSMEGRLSKFANAYMIVNFGKLVFFSIIIVVYAILNKEDAVPFMLTFFIYYFVFTFYEVISLLQIKK